MKENDFSFINRLYLCALFPNVIAVLGGTVNVLFDGILVGRRLGDAGLAAVNMSFPVYLVLCALGALVASGAAQLSAMAIGENKKQESIRIFRCAVMLSAVISAAVCMILLAFSQPLTELLASGESTGYVRTYVQITLIGGIFKVMLYVPYFYLRLEGKNMHAMRIMLIMTVINIVLDYIFLFICDFGIAGAAWASVIATVVACVLGFIYLCSDEGDYRIGFSLPGREDLVGITRYGAMMSFNNILSAVRIFALNKVLWMFGAAEFTAVFAVVNSISEFSMCIQNGVPQASGAMIGILAGERDSASIKKLLRMQIVCGCLLSAVFAAVLIVFAGSMGGIFGSSADCTKAVCCFAASLVFATVNNIFSYYYNATGNVWLANISFLFRVCVFAIGFCFMFGRLGLTVWLFFPAAELATMMLCFMAGSVRAGLKNLNPFYLIDDSPEKNGRSLSVSVEAQQEKICEASEKIQEFCENNDMPPKTCMVVGLAAEEIMMIITEKSLKTGSDIDVRVLSSNDTGILRIRSGGERYNPLAVQDESDEYMGIRMIKGLAKKVDYQSALGVNTLTVVI